MFRRLEKADYEQYYSLINDFRPTIFTYRQFIDFLENLEKNIHIWIIEESNQIVATATVIYETKLIHNICKYAHIEDVCVSKKYRGQNYGSKLLQFLFSQCKDCLKITLVCDKNISDFYIKNGLEIRGVQCCQLVSNLSL